MAHEVESMAYAGETPWHGLGTKVDHLMTSEEAIHAAELDWTVSTQDVFLADGRRCDQWRAVVRNADQRIYAVLGAGYVPVQNSEAFKFFDEVVGSKEAYYETAGSLRGGSRVWLLANLKDSLSVQGEEVRRYLTLVNSHDGSLALQMFWTPVRVVCMNTLSMALSSATNSFYARHTTYIQQRVYDAQEVLGLAKKYYEDFAEKANLMAQRQLSPAKMPLLLVAAFQTSGSRPIDAVYQPDDLRRKFNKVEELVAVGRGMDNPAIRGTVWQGYNAVCEYADYNKTYKDNSASNRLYNTWFGAGAEMKRRAWNWCLNEVK